MDGERFERVPLRPPGGRPGHVVAVWLTIGLAVVVVAVVGRSLPPKSIAQASLPPMLASPSPVAATSRPAWPPRAAGPPPRTGTAVDLAGLGPAATPSRVLPPGRADIAVGAGAVWVVTTADATARRLDPVTLEVSPPSPCRSIGRPVPARVAPSPSSSAATSGSRASTPDASSGSRRPVRTRSRRSTPAVRSRPS
jgi:hypothetical protein